MKLKLLFQKVYFKSSEWLELVSYVKSISSDISILLLSKNIFFNSFKIVKMNFLGECLIIELSNNTEKNILSLAVEVINKLNAKYLNRIFFIGFLYEFNNKLFFFNLNDLKNYNSYFLYRTNYSSNININSLFLIELIKYFKLLEAFYGLRLYFLKNNMSYSNFCYYY